MYVCMHACVYVGTQVRRYVGTKVRMYVCIYLIIYLFFIYLFVYLCMYVYMYLCIYVSIYLSVCICMYMYVYVCICMYTYVKENRPGLKNHTSYNRLACQKQQNTFRKDCVDWTLIERLHFSERYAAFCACLPKFQNNYWTFDGKTALVWKRTLLASSAALGGGGSFKNRKPIGEFGCCDHGWQSESTDGPKGGWSRVFWSGCNGCSGHLTHNCWM